MLGIRLSSAWRGLATTLGLLVLLSPSPAGAAPVRSAADDPIDTEVLRSRLGAQHRLEADAKQRAVASQRTAGIESTPNQALYDVAAYGLVMTLNPGTQILTGTATVTAVVTGPSLLTMDLDLRAGMNVTSATSAGLPTSFSRAGDVLTVNLDHAYATGQTVVVGVGYNGNPAAPSFNWGSFGGQPMIWTLSQPFGARDWWPCKDLNTDKADSLDLTVTVPSSLIAASNGVLLSDVTVGPNRTFHWRTGHPIVPYLVSLAVHPFTVLTDSWSPPGGGGPMPLEHYLFASSVTPVSPLLTLTGPMLTAFSDAFGTYPFADEKYGHADFLGGGAVEHQTLSSMGFWNTDVIAHEMAHQWFGDDVTCADFGHIWLNEGFATWCEAYWQEVSAGPQAYHAYMDATAYYGGGTVFVEDPLTENIFDVALSYSKGSWIVHMLRGVLGDEDFFTGLNDYLSQYAYGSATTEQFRDVMEAASGIDLDAFFAQWVYGDYFPEYRLTWSQTLGTLDFDIEQTQTTGLFEMPLRIRIFTTTDTLDTTVQNALALENYSIAVPGTVLNVQLDPDRWVLKRDASPLTNATLAEGILLVNGVEWPIYGSEIINAYNAKAFWGSLDISFWDVFDEPVGGYPGTLPPPVGHGRVPPDTLGRYSAVIWIGNNFGGDLAKWGESPIQQYLEAGGNLVLITRLGDSFFDAGLLSYLGITWTGDDIGLGSCNAVYPGLLNIPLGAGQSLIDVFSTTVGPNSTLLFSGTGAFPGTQGVGVIVEPPGGGTHRPDGGKLVYLAGRPYRMQATSLSSNIEFVMSHFFGEPYVPLSVRDRVAGPSIALAPPAPNPSGGRVAFGFDLPRAGHVELAIYDVGGRRIRTLLSAARGAGTHTAFWDGAGDDGRAVAPGTYYARLSAPGGAATRGLVRMR